MSRQELLVNSVKQNKDDANLTARDRHDGRVKDKFNAVGPRNQLQNVCGNCGRRHGRRNCSAFRKKCHSCNKLNHFEKMCRSKNVSAVQEDSGSESDSLYVISAISKDKKKKVSKAKVATTNLYISVKKGQRTLSRFRLTQGPSATFCPLIRT